MCRESFVKKKKSLSEPQCKMVRRMYYAVWILPHRDTSSGLKSRAEWSQDYVNLIVQYCLLSSRTECFANVHSIMLAADFASQSLHFINWDKEGVSSHKNTERHC